MRSTGRRQSRRPSVGTVTGTLLVHLADRRNVAQRAELVSTTVGETGPPSGFERSSRSSHAVRITPLLRGVGDPQTIVCGPPARGGDTLEGSWTRNPGRNRWTASGTVGGFQYGPPHGSCRSIWRDARPGARNGLGPQIAVHGFAADAELAGQHRLRSPAAARSRSRRAWSAVRAGPRPV
jgi:hypothetical protein